MNREANQQADRRPSVRLTEVERNVIMALFRRRNATPEAVALAFGIGSHAAYALRRKARLGLSREVAA